MSSAISEPSGANAATGPVSAAPPSPLTGSLPPVRDQARLLLGQGQRAGTPRGAACASGITANAAGADPACGPADLVGPRPGTPQHGEVPAHAERRAQVAGQRADVGPAGAGDRDVGVQQIAAAANGPDREACTVTVRAASSGAEPSRASR